MYSSELSFSSNSLLRANRRGIGSRSNIPMFVVDTGVIITTCEVKIQLLIPGSSLQIGDLSRVEERNGEETERSLSFRERKKPPKRCPWPRRWSCSHSLSRSRWAPAKMVFEMVRPIALKRRSFRRPIGSIVYTPDHEQAVNSSPSWPVISDTQTGIVEKHSRPLPYSVIVHRYFLRSFSSCHEMHS